MTKKTLGGLVEIVGIVVLIQGGGLAISRYFWDRPFGLTSVLDEVVPLAWWAGVLIAIVGALVIAGGYVLTQQAKQEE